jgi:predicted ATPase
MIKKIILKDAKESSYPYSVPSIKTLDELTFNTNITIFVGDNGSGKSTLLKAIAQNHNAINTAGSPIDSETYDVLKPLSEKLKLSYNTKNQKGFLFSGDEFITFINRLEAEKKDLLSYVKETKTAYKDKSDFALDQALGPAIKELRALETMYGGELGEKSHGESFLAFFKSRMRPGGIYFLDEPETPLSTMNQFQLFVMISDLAKTGAQIILATHSPILMALENAVIYEFNESIEVTTYDQIDSVNFLKDFMNNREKYIERIFYDDDQD